MLVSLSCSSSCCWGDGTSPLFAKGRHSVWIYTCDLAQIFTPDASWCSPYRDLVFSRWLLYDATTRLSTDMPCGCEHMPISQNINRLHEKALSFVLKCNVLAENLHVSKFILMSFWHVDLTAALLPWQWHSPKAVASTRKQTQQSSKDFEFQTCPIQ